MKKELEEKFIEVAPVFLQDMYGDMMKTCMAWGFECGDGWFDPLLKAMIAIEAVNKRSRGKFIADQIKSKYAELRIYWHSTEGTTKDEEDEIDRIIEQAEKDCWAVCELCGQPAIKTTTGWLTRVCKDHDKDFNIGGNEL